MKLVLTVGLAILALSGLLFTTPSAFAAKSGPAVEAGQLIVEDAGGLFSREGISAAKAEFAKLMSAPARQVTILTLKELPAAKMTSYEAMKKDGKEDQFWSDFAKEEATAERAKGVFILICRKPGYIHIIADKAVRDAGFDKTKEDKARETLLTAFRNAKDLDETQAQPMRDQALLDVATQLRNDIPPAKGGQQAAKQAGEGSSIMGYVCIGLAVLMGVWLIIGLIRAFTGGGGGASGGGGFMTGLLGGLFGAMAGMWLYNNLFGGSSWGDTSGGDYGGGESGGGDFSGDAGSGGGWDGGGGGGDWGGGGDF